MEGSALQEMMNAAPAAIDEIKRDLQVQTDEDSRQRAQEDFHRSLFALADLEPASHRDEYVE